MAVMFKGFQGPVLESKEPPSTIKLVILFFLSEKMRNVLKRMQIKIRFLGIFSFTKIIISSFWDLNDVYEPA